MRFLYSFLFFTLVCIHSGYAQREAENWWMYGDLLVNSSTFPPTYTLNAQPDFIEPLNNLGTAAISNREGNLLLYTNGRKIYGGNHKVVFDGAGLNCGDGGEDRIVIIPKGVNEKEYYVIYTDSDLAPSGYKYDTSAYYSLVSVKKQAVVHKNVLVQKTSQNVLAATFHENDIDTWVVFCGYNSSRLYAYLFTECGIEGPVISDMNLAPARKGRYHHFRFSPNSKKLLTCFDKYYLCDFDNVTGKVSAPAAFPECYSDFCFKEIPMVFSPNSQYLYNTESNFDKRLLYQFDILKRATIHETASTGDMCNMYPYLCSDGNLYWEDINGLNCNSKPGDVLRKENIKPLPKSPTKYNNNIAQPSFSNFLSSYMDPDYRAIAEKKGTPIVKASRVCDGDSTVFQVSRTLGVSEYWWSFGDGSVVYNIKEPRHLYKKSGIYSATLIVRYSCIYDTISFKVSVDDPYIEQRDTKMLSCNAVELNAADDFSSYQWNTGDTTKSVVAGAGEYTVSLTNGCGVYSQKFVVEHPETELYNVITPNGDGKNDVLAFAETSLSISLTVYNRWGKMLYRNNDYKNDWTGDDLLAGVYYYECNYQGCKPQKSWLQIIK